MRDDVRRFPGVVFRGAADAAAVAGAVTAACSSQGLACVRREEAGGVHLEAHQRGPWRQVLLRGLPQRIDWRIEPRGDELWLWADFRVRPGYLAALAGCALAALVLLAAAWWSTAGDVPWAWLACSVAGLSLVLAVAFGFRPLGGGVPAAELWSDLEARVADANGRLEPLHLSVTRRYFVAACSWALVVLSALAVAAVFAPGFRYLPVLDVSQVAMVVVALWMLASPWVMRRTRGVEQRLEALVTGLGTLVAMILLLSLAVLLETLGGVLTEPAAVTLEHRDVAREVLLALAAVLLFAVGFFLYLPRVARVTSRGLDRMYRNRNAGLYREAVASPAVLRAIRRVVVGVWIVAAGVVLSALMLIAEGVLQLLGAAPFHPGSDGAAVLTRLVEWATSEPGGGTPAVAGTVAAGAWIAYASLAFGLWLLSVADLWRARRRNRTRLRAGLIAGEVRRQVDELAARAGLDPARLHVALGRAGDDDLIDAEAHRFGLLRPERWLEVSRGALERIGPAHRRALLAHELAHHVAGHCAAFGLLRWLGRLTLTGDGFSLALQDSFGYEEEADRIAVERFGVPPADLAGVLLMLQRQREVRGVRRRDRARGLPSSGRDGGEEPAPAAAGPLGPWRDGLRLLLLQYRQPVDRHYWHPSLEARRAALAAAVPPSSGAGAETR